MRGLLLRGESLLLLYPVAALYVRAAAKEKDLAVQSFTSTLFSPRGGLLINNEAWCLERIREQMAWREPPRVLVILTASR